MEMQRSIFDKNLKSNMRFSWQPDVAEPWERMKFAFISRPPWGSKEGDSSSGAGALTAAGCVADRLGAGAETCGATKAELRSRSACGAGCGESGARAAGSAGCLRVERPGRRSTESFASLLIRIPLKFCQNSGKLSKFFRNSENS